MSKNKKSILGLLPTILTTLLLCNKAVLVAQTTDTHQNIVKYTNQKALTALAASFSEDLLAQQQAYKGPWHQKQILADGSAIALNELGTDGTPLHYTTYAQPMGTSAKGNALYCRGIGDLGLAGRGITIGVWDAGTALKTHQEFGSRVHQKDKGAVDNHGTMVTGTIVSAGIEAKAQGVAHAATAYSHDWGMDKIEAAKAAANGLLLSNHSYGIKSKYVPDWYFGAYIKISQEWDQIMYHAPYYLMVVAAGNAQNAMDNEAPIYGKTKDGYDLLLGFSTAKNGLVIAGASTKIDAKGDLITAQVSGYSSLGPTDDGRIKPDLAGDGALIHAASANSNSSYSSSMGTSMAAPGVTGSLALLQEYHHQLFDNYMTAASLKGLVLHAADDVGAIGPDYKMGWGVMNTKKAATVINNKGYSSLITEATLKEGESYSFTVQANEYEALSASLSWTDPAGQQINTGVLNDTTPSLTNDLDIRITQNGTTYYPWKLEAAKAANKAKRGDNTVDPYERVDIEQPQGIYTITVTHKGSLKYHKQHFSLIVSGLQLTACNAETPKTLQITQHKDLGTLLSWDRQGQDSLYELQLKAADQELWTTHTSWDNQYPLNKLRLGTLYQARIRTACSANIASDFSKIFHFVYQGKDTKIRAEAPKSNLKLAVFPNPTTDWLQINATASQEASYTILSTAGIVLHKAKLAGDVPVAQLPAGLYVIMVKDDLGTRTTKFVKQ